MLLIDMFPPIFWYELGFGVSLMLNLVFGIVIIGIIFPFRQIDASQINYRMRDIVVGSLFGLLIAMVVAVMTMTPPFNNPIIAIFVYGGFCGCLALAIWRIFHNG
jgi:hypothetical protein